MKWQGRIITGIIFLSLFVLGTVALAAAQGFETEARSAVMMDAASGQILYEKNSHERLAPASVTKVMTLLLAIEAIKKGKAQWDDRVVGSEEAASFGGSQIYLEAGEEFSLRDLLISVAVASANDASVAVAEHLSGSHEAFVADMNKRAKELGLKNTNFVNACGLPAEDHYTSAYDMAQISRQAVKYPEIMELTKIKHYELRDGQFKLDNTNKLLWWYRGADGIKTGYTNEAKRCLASTAERNGLRLITVVLGVEKIKGHFSETIRMYNYGYANFAFKEIAPQNARVIQLPVGKGAADRLAVIAPEKIGVVVKKGEEKDINYRIMLPMLVKAPVKKGQVLGHILIYKKDKEVGRANLAAGDNVPRGSLSRQLYKTLRYVYSTGQTKTPVGPVELTS